MVKVVHGPHRVAEAVAVIAHPPERSICWCLRGRLLVLQRALYRLMLGARAFFLCLLFFGSMG